MCFVKKKQDPGRENKSFNLLLIYANIGLNCSISWLPDNVPGGGVHVCGDQCGCDILISDLPP